LLHSFLLTELGKKYGRVSVLAIRQTPRMNSNGAIFLKFGTVKPTAELVVARPGLSLISQLQ
jgi:hypothetical protein